VSQALVNPVPAFSVCGRPVAGRGRAFAGRKVHFLVQYPGTAKPLRPICCRVPGLIRGTPRLTDAPVDCKRCLKISGAALRGAEQEVRP
jgi:hypothetical protein